MTDDKNKSGMLYDTIYAYIYISVAKRSKIIILKGNHGMTLTILYVINSYISHLDLES